MVSKTLFSSNTDLWATPQELFEKLDSEFHFTLDPCALPSNAKCANFFTPEDDGLLQDWSAHTVFCNPPYGKEIMAWVKKCWHESLKGATVVMLIPARTDTAYFHDFILGKAEIRFIRGRLKFGGAKNTAPFPSMLAIYRPNSELVNCHINMFIK